jgi:hypothetical protein
VVLPFNYLQPLRIPNLNNTTISPTQETNREHKTLGIKEGYVNNRHQEQVLSKRIRPNIKSSIRIGISIILVDRPCLRVDILPHIESPAHLRNSTEHRVRSKMFSGTDSTTPTEGGGCFFGGGERFCLRVLGVIEEATGVEGMRVGVVEFRVVDCPGNVSSV